MAQIQVPEGLPAIRSLFGFRPETARPLSELAEVLLHTPGTLSMADRELIATCVSSLSDCHYCQTSHGAIAAHHLQGDEQLVLDVKRDPESAAISPKLKALPAIAAKVQRSGREVRAEDIERAPNEGATDLEIHDTVLIAAAFCMYNRYVDGLGTLTPTDADSYRQRAARVAEDGYLGLPAVCTAIPA